MDIGQTLYVTDTEINRVLREVAKAAHEITDPKDLQNFPPTHYVWKLVFFSMSQRNPLISSNSDCGKDQIPSICILEISLC